VVPTVAGVLAFDSVDGVAGVPADAGVCVPVVDSVAAFAGVLLAAGGPTVVFLLFLVVPAIAGVPAVGGVPAVTGVHALSLPSSSCVYGRIPHIY
jgi:hypothetical protein